MRLAISIFVALAMVSCQKKPTRKVVAPDTTHIVFKDNQGHIIEETDLTGITGDPDYEVLEKRSIDQRSLDLHKEARKAGEAGNYDEAISKLQQAIKFTPAWAYPPYDLAFTYMLQGNSQQALKYYKLTDSLEPKGFFTAKTAVYALEGERSGKFPAGTYAAFLKIEFTGDPVKRLEIAKAITETAPDFAPAWKEMALLLPDTAAKLHAIEQGLSKSPDRETKGILLINKAIILNEQGKKAEAKKMLGTLIFSPDATIGSVELAKFSLKRLL